MKKNIYIILLILVIGCVKKESPVIEYYPNHTKKAEYYLNSKGEYTGVCLDYFPSGNVQFSRNYLNGSLNGKCYEYNVDGRLKKEASFTKDKPHGWFIEYDSTGKVVKKELSILLYSNMFYAKNSKYLEEDTANFIEKEDYVNCCYYYNNNKLVRDSTYFCQLNFDSGKPVYQSGEIINFTISVPYNYFNAKVSNERLQFLFRVEDSNQNIIIRDKNFIHPVNIPTMIKASIKPRRKGIGYIYGAIREINGQKECHEYYFREMYEVR